MPHFPAFSAMWNWIDRNILALSREMRLSYLPPLMVYMAAGVSGLTGIVGTFFVKEYLGLSAAFLVALGFWAGIPWALKMPIGHLIDLAWRHKAWFVWAGASLIAASLLIMLGLIAHRDAMQAVMAVESWFVLATLLSPVGFVVQDAVADAMTVEAVPHVDEAGQPVPPEQIKLMHTTMQTLGRVAIIGGTLLVALVNVGMFSGASQLSPAEQARIYANVYRLALIIPLVSVLGVISAAYLRRRVLAAHLARGVTRADALALMHEHIEKTPPNWWVLGGSLVFVAFTLGMGFSGLKYNQEVIFVGSLIIILTLIVRLTRELEPGARETLIGTALIIFAFRATSSPGPGVTWWMIDELKFDQQFLAMLSLLASACTLAGMFIFRRYMAERSISAVVVMLTVTGFVLSLPTLGMSFGLHHWTASVTGGVVDARFIALIDTALESPLGQIAMIPMLAWIANSAPDKLKATYFAVMASFTNLALSASQLGSKYLNQVFTISREVKNPATGAIQTAANYGDLSMLLLTAIAIGVLMPFAAIAIARMFKWRSA